MYKAVGRKSITSLAPRYETQGQDGKTSFIRQDGRSSFIKTSSLSLGSDNSKNNERLRFASKQALPPDDWVETISSVLKKHHEDLKKEWQKWSLQQEELLKDLSIFGPTFTDHSWKTFNGDFRNGTSGDSEELSQRGDSHQDLQVSSISPPGHLSGSSRTLDFPLDDVGVASRRISVEERIATLKQVGGEGLFESGNFVPLAQEPNATINCKLYTVWFEGLCAIMILINSVTIAYETEDKAQGNPTPKFLEVTSYAVNIWFVVELLVRLSVTGPRDFFTKDIGWNYFDVALVLLWFVDEVGGELPYSFLRGILRVLRLLRVLRILRIFRFVRQIREFRKMIYAIGMSMNTLGWSLLLLFFEIFFFSIVFMQGVNSAKEEQQDIPFEGLNQRWGRTSRAYYSLFMAICGGISWGEVMDPLLELSPTWLYAGMFLSYISLTMFGIMNVLTAVFVESAMSSTQHNRDLLIDEKESAKRMYVSHIREIFNQIDSDGGGTITTDEIEQIFRDPSMSRLLQALEIDAYDAHSMFKLLDVDDSGSIDIEEFCDGCLRLKGDAKSFDIQCLMYETQRLATKTRALLVCNEESFGELRGIVRKQALDNGNKFMSLARDVSLINQDVAAVNTSISDLRSLYYKQAKHARQSMALSRQSMAFSRASDALSVVKPSSDYESLTCAGADLILVEPLVEPKTPDLMSASDFQARHNSRSFHFGPECFPPRKKIVDGVYSL